MNSLRETLRLEGEFCPFSANCANCEENLNNLEKTVYGYAKRYAHEVIGTDSPEETNVMIAIEHAHQRIVNNKRKGKL